MTEIRRRRHPHDGASNHGEDGDMSDRSAASRSSREQGRRNRGRKEVKVEEIMMMKNLKKRMMIILNIDMVADIVEEAIMRRG